MTTERENFDKALPVGQEEGQTQGVGLGMGLLPACCSGKAAKRGSPRAQRQRAAGGAPALVPSAHKLLPRPRPPPAAAQHPPPPLLQLSGEREEKLLDLLFPRLKRCVWRINRFCPTLDSPAGTEWGREGQGVQTNKQQLLTEN